MIILSQEEEMQVLWLQWVQYCVHTIPLLISLC